MTKPRLTSTLATLAFAALLAACGCGSRSTGTTPTGSGAGSGSGPMGNDVPPGTVDIKKLGADCGEGDKCEAGSCVRFYGIAGPSGPEFKSCEIACPNGKGPCPDGTACTQIADGPGAVCRPTDAPPAVEP